MGLKGKSDTRKHDYTTQGNKPESIGERKKFKMIAKNAKTIRTKQDIPKPTIRCNGSKIIFD